MSTGLKFKLLTVVVLATAWVHTLLAQAGGLSAAELEFIQTAARIGMEEIRLGQVAQQRASSQAVKGLAQRMSDDCVRSNRELADIAQRKGVILPPDNEGALSGSAIAQTTGAEFDRLFPVAVISAHTRSLEIFEQEANGGTDLDVKNWATKNLLTLRTHLADAKALVK